MSRSSDPFDAIANPAPDPLPKESASGSHSIATLKDIRTITATASAVLEKKIGATKTAFKWGSLAAGLSLIGVVGGGLMSVRAVAKDAGTDAAKAALDDLDLVKAKQIIYADEQARHIREEAHERERMGKKLDRVEDKLDLLMDAAKIPLSRRPSADGGE